MEEENKIKKKIKLKGIFNNRLILKREYIQNKIEKNYLLLNKEYKVFDEGKVFKLNYKKENSQQNILSCKSLSKSFDGRRILKNISFNLKKGQIIGLLGPNGSGKTTIFKTLSGEIAADTGDIIFNGKKINSDPIYVRSRKGISYLQTSKGLFDNLTAYENLYGVLELHMNNKEKIDQKINKLLSYFGLQYLANVKARYMSAGETKKIATLQRVCNQNISVLLMDEPISALDPISISSIKNFILEIKRMNIGIIITEHNVASISDILDYVILIRDGQIMAEGTMKEVSKNKDAIKYYLGSNFKF